MAKEVTISVTSGDKNLHFVLAKPFSLCQTSSDAAHFDLSLPIFL
jgi:hypothetical protein